MPFVGLRFAQPNLPLRITPQLHPPPSRRAATPWRTMCSINSPWWAASRASICRMTSVMPTETCNSHRRCCTWRMFMPCSAASPRMPANPLRCPGRGQRSTLRELRLKHPLEDTEPRQAACWAPSHDRLPGPPLQFSICPSPAVSMALATLIAELDDAALLQLFSNSAVSKGRAYVNRVGRFEVAGHTLSASVQGSEPRPYRTSVRLERRDFFGDVSVEIATRCTCPVGNRCKHAVALLLAARRPGALVEKHAQ